MFKFLYTLLNVIGNTVPYSLKRNPKFFFFIVISFVFIMLFITKIPSVVFIYNIILFAVYFRYIYKNWNELKNYNPYIDVE